MQATTHLLTAVFAVIAASAFPSTANANEGEGLTAAPRWQGRVVLGTATSGNLFGNAAPALRSFSVMGDYYFSQRVASKTSTSALSDLLGGNFRATSGLMIGPRGLPNSSVTSAPSNPGNFLGSARSFSVDLRSATLLSSEASASEPNAVPYLGVGYTGASAKGGWGFSADVGLMALNPSSAVKLGRVLGGGQSLDDTLREMRVSPVLQLGVSYSF